VIGFLRGEVAARAPGACVLDVGGVGYSLSCSTTTLAALPRAGSATRLWTHLHVREDELALYGFAEEDERAVFVALLGVSGIGPKVALSLCSALPPESFRRALAHDDVAALAAVPGIGRKTAQRVLLDLKEKLAGAPATAPFGPETEALARSALENLGYSAAEVRSALESLDGDAGDSVEEVVRSALKVLA
jgi:holliday junction DNA helicase RuvA